MLLVKYVVTVISILNEYTLRPSLQLIRSNGVEMRVIYILNNKIETLFGNKEQVYEAQISYVQA